MEADEEQEIEKPEVIDVETEEYDVGRESEGFQEEFKHYYHKSEKRNFPVSVRIVSFFCALLLLFVLLLVVPFILLFLGVNLITLFQWEAFWKKTRQVMKVSFKMLVTSLGLLTAVISPSLGMSLIASFFMARGNRKNRAWVDKMFRK